MATLGNVHWRPALVGLWLLTGGCADSATQSDTPALPETGIVTVCSDYASTSISVLDSSSLTVVLPAYLHSGTVVPGVGAALGGDVSLPTTLSPGDALVLDRYPAGVLTWLEEDNANLPRQVSVGKGFAANPHDALRLPDGRWFVTRYGSNPAGETADEMDRGDDVLILSAQREPVGRITFEQVVEGPARPDRLLQVGEDVWVSLNRAAGDFQTWWEGAIVVLPQGTGTMMGLIPVEGLKNCGLMAGAAWGVTAACGGRFEGGSPVLEDGGLVVLNTAGQEVARLMASDPRVGGAFGGGLSWREDGAVLAVVFGDEGVAPDRVIAWLPEENAIEEVYTGSGAFRLSGFAFDGSGEPLIVDADPKGGLLCRPGDGLCVNPCPTTGLPPRGVLALGRP